MKRILALLLIFCLLFSACGQHSNEGVVPSSSSKDNESPATDSIIHTQENTPLPETTPTDGAFDPDETEPAEETSKAPVECHSDVPDFYDLNDPRLLQYVEDNIYANLVDEFSSEDYIIENVNAIFYSKEYLEEVAYNSKANIFFGYTLAELDEQFQGEQYVFTLNDDGETTVQPFQNYDDTYEQVIKNIAIGTGIILVCVTVSVVGGAAGASTMSMIFAASAKTGTTFALSSAGFSGVFSGVLTGIQTKDFEQAINTAVLTGSESFKWGAISGALIGGLNEAHALRNVANAIDDVPSWRQSELDVLEKYGGNEQMAYIDGKQVPSNTLGSTRPDVVRSINNHLEAIEVKNYNLESSNSLNTLYNELERQIGARVTNCPPKTTQRVVLDVRGRNYSQELISSVSEAIETRLIDIYPNIPIDILAR